ncbi:MAG: enoyl-CoA hydratase/isomerase family protein [Fimbriiglobus sp.]
MIYDDGEVCVYVRAGVAYLRFGWLGMPCNTLHLGRLRQLAAAWRAVVALPTIEVMVFESAKLQGFSTGYDFGDSLSECDWAWVAREGHALLEELSQLPIVTVACLHGPCLGAGVDLAAACDYRFATTGWQSWFGYPHGQPAVWGGAARLRMPTTLFSAREATQCGWIDDAYCERRAKVETMRHILHIQRRPRKRPRTLSDAQVRGLRQWSEVSPTSGDIPVSVETALRRGLITPLEAAMPKQPVSETPSLLQRTLAKLSRVASGRWAR